MFRKLQKIKRKLSEKTANLLKLKINFKKTLKTSLFNK